MIQLYRQILDELVADVKTKELYDDYQSRRLLAQTIYFATYFNILNTHSIELL